MAELGESHTVILTDEEDLTPGITALNVNGDDYKIDYDGLKNVPVIMKKVPGDYMLESTEVTLTMPK